MTPVLIVLILATTSFSLQPIGFCQLIRPNYVYRNLISGIHDHFNNTCILLLHATVDPMSSADGTRNAVRLLDLQRYFSQERHTRTAIMDLETFSSKVGLDYFRIKRPLFVILNDQGDVRQLLISVSMWITMAYPTWMMFLSEGTVPDEFFKGMNIPFDCEFMVSTSVGQTEIITEVYRVSPGDVLRTSNFAKWTPEKGVRITDLQGLYQRRNDLFGKTLCVTSIENPPMSTILTDERGEMIGIGGMFGRILDILKDNMNCSFRYIEGKAWGVLSPNGTWNGMIALLTEKVADLAASELVLTSTRINAVDFTIPIVSSRFHTYIKRPSSLFVSWKGYTAPFATSIWLALGSLIVLSSVVITVAEYLGHRYNDDNRDGEFPRPRLGSTVLAVFGAFCGQGMLTSVLPTTRAAHLAVHLTSVVLVAAYSAALISFLAVQTFTMPFTTMEGLLRDGTYRFGVIPYSAEYSLFSNTTDPVLRALFEERMVPDEQLPLNYFEGLRSVCREHGYGFMITDTMVGALENRVDCVLEALETMLQTSLAMAVTKDSPYRGIIDANILMMRDGGILKRIIESEWPTKFNKAEESWTSVKFGDVVPLMILLAGGIILGVIIACAERAVVGRSHRGPVQRGGRAVKFEPSASMKYTQESDRLSKTKINVVFIPNK